MKIILEFISRLLRGLSFAPSPSIITNNPPQPTLLNIEDKVILKYPRLDPIQYAMKLRLEVNKRGPWPTGYDMVPDNPNTPQDETETYCNFFVRVVCKWFNYHTFELLDKGMANQMVKYLQSHKEWQAVSFKESAILAAAGHLVIAGWVNPVGIHGHVCIIIPCNTLVYSDSFKTNVPFCANVGKRNFYGQALSLAFTPSSMPTTYLFLGAV